MENECFQAIFHTKKKSTLKEYIFILFSIISMYLYRRKSWLFFIESFLVTCSSFEYHFKMGNFLFNSDLEWMEDENAKSGLVK